MTALTDEFSDVRANPPLQARRYPGALVFPHRKKLGPHAYIIIPDRPNADFGDFTRHASRDNLVNFFRAARSLVCDIGLDPEKTKSLIVINAVSADSFPNNCNSQQNSTHMHAVFSDSGADFPLHDLTGGPGRSYCPQPNMVADTWIANNRFQANPYLALPPYVAEAPAHAVLIGYGSRGRSFLGMLGEDPSPLLPEQKNLMDTGLRRFFRQMGRYVQPRVKTGGVRVVIDEIFRPAEPHIRTVHFYGGNMPGALGKNRWFEAPKP